MKVFIFWLLLFATLSASSAQNTLYLSEPRSFNQIPLQNIAVFEDTAHLSIDQILTKKFKPCTITQINSGFSTSTFWYKLKVNSQQQRQWIFNVSGTLVDYIDFYEVMANGQIIKRVSGDMYPFSQREIAAPTFAFYFDMHKNESRTLYIAIQSNDTKQFTLNVYSSEYYNKQLNLTMFRWFFYFGMLFMMFVYNLLLYFSLRDITYLYYVFYIGSFSLMQFSIFGYGNQFIWGENVWFGNRAPTFFAGLTTIFIALFSYKYLNIKELFPKLKVVFVYLVTCGATIILINIPKPTAFTNALAAVVSVPNVLIMLVIGLMVLLKGYKPAKYYMAAWGLLFVSIAIFLLNTLGIIAKSNLNNLILPIGCMLEVTLLSFALGKRITTIEQDKTEAQKELVNQLKNNERVRTRIARDLHDDLGSTLSSIHILSEVAQTESKNNSQKLPGLLQKITTSAKKLQENLQDIVWTTQNNDDKTEHLVVRMRQFGGEILEAKNINYQIAIHKKINEMALNADIQYDIFMIFKEAINNIVKYAGATEVKVEFGVENNEIFLSIVDNGRGFDLDTEKNGNGLKNMASRAIKINGAIEINTKPNAGTHILMKI